MLFTLLAKVLGTSVGLVAAMRYPGHPVWVAALLGITPIWLELAATAATGLEPSLEKRPLWKFADAVVDALSFVLVPAAWLAAVFGGPGLLPWGLAVFVGCGIYRLQRFVRRGLVDGQHFEGLPVTYTGYAWFVCAFALAHGWVLPATVVLCTLGFLMVWTRFQVRRTQTRNDPAPVD
jgi:hypothetical protein